MLSVMIQTRLSLHTCPTSFKRKKTDKGSCDPLATHPPPHTTTGLGPWVFWYYPGHYGPETVQEILGTAHMGHPSLPASSPFPLEWSPMVFSCPTPLPHCRLSWVGLLSLVQRLSTNQHPGREGAKVRCPPQKTGARVEVLFPGSRCRELGAPFLPCTPLSNASYSALLWFL